MVYPLLQQLKQLARICFVDTFRQSLSEKYLNLDAEFNENSMQENKNGHKNSEEHFDLIRKQQWLTDFPRGAKLLTYLYQILISSEADQQLEPLLRILFTKSVQPIFSMISSFVNYGDFEDPFSEFWVEKSPLRISQSDNKIPSFLQSSALEIFKTGQSLSFLRSLESTLVYYKICAGTTSITVDKFTDLRQVEQLTKAQ